MSLSHSESMVNAHRKLDCAALIFTVYAEAGHNSWTKSYNNPQLYEWFLSHTLKDQIRDPFGE